MRNKLLIDRWASNSDYWLKKSEDLVTNQVSYQGYHAVPENSLMGNKLEQEIQGVALNIAGMVAVLVLGSVALIAISNTQIRA